MKSKISIICLAMLAFAGMDKVNALEKKELPKQNFSPIVVDGFEIRKYPQFYDQNVAKEYLISNYSDSINKIRGLTNNKISSIDNKKFQEFVLGTDVMVTEKDKDFRAHIDIYENYFKNLEIDSLYSQYLQTDNTTEKQRLLIEIENIMPVDLTLVDNTTILPSIGFVPMGVPSIMLPLDPGTYSNGYNRNVARDYAWDWAYGRNNNKYGYYSNYYNCESCWNDCANFISQILYEGGMKEYKISRWLGIGNLIKESSNNWYYFESTPSNSWGGANNFYGHWSKRAQVTTSASNVTEMDPISLDFAADGDMDHTVIIFNKTASGADYLYYAAHTSDRRGDVSIQDAIGSTGKWYGYRMITAKNDGTFR